MSDQSDQSGESGRGAAEENTGVAETSEEHDDSPATSNGHDQDFRADGAAEENTGVADTPEEHNEPASPASTPGDSDVDADGYVENEAAPE